MMMELEPWKILVVDDDEDIQMSTQIILSRLHVKGTPIELLAATSTQAAKNKMAEHKDIAVVLLDVVMESNTSGLDLADYIRSELGNDTIQIVLRTGQAAKAPAAEALDEHDIDFYLEKNAQNHALLINLVRASVSNYQRKQKLKETLTKAKEKAEKLACSRMAFLAYMAHEIRGSLGQFAQGATILAGTKLDERQKKLIELVQNGGEQVLEFCNDFLDHEKMNLGQMKLESIAFNLTELLKEVVEANKLGLAAIDKEKVNIRLSIDTNLPEKIVSDPTRLRQIVNNLLVNAVKFTDKGDVDLSVGLNSDDDQEGIEVLFLVKDAGIGVPENKLTEIFDPYTQAEDSTTRIFKGTGLGLSICKQFVELMQGRMWAENNADVGSCFFFTINAKKICG